MKKLSPEEVAQVEALALTLAKQAGVRVFCGNCWRTARQEGNDVQAAAEVFFRNGWRTVGGVSMCASCVKGPSLNVARIEFVTPLPIVRVLTIFASCRNFSISASATSVAGAGAADVWARTTGPGIRPGTRRATASPAHAAVDRGNLEATAHLRAAFCAHGTRDASPERVEARRADYSSITE